MDRHFLRAGCVGSWLGEIDEYVPVVAVASSQLAGNLERVITWRVTKRASKDLRDDVLRSTEVGENDFGLLNPLFGREGGRATSYYRAEVVLEGRSIDFEEAGEIESVVGDGLEGMYVRVG